ncbi:cation-translocating P-type ATPase [Chloroflexota bacterium]
MQNGKSWYQLPIEQVFEALETGNDGLTRSEAKARLEQYGYNELKVKKRGPFVRFLLQFHNPLLYVLMVAAVIAALLDKFMDMWVIIGVILATVVIGFIQEGKAEASLEALKKMLASVCNVMRDGKLQQIATRELVPGDVVLVEGGDKVPADLRLFSLKNLSVDEAALTGESLSDDKSIDAIPRPDLSPGQQHCMCFNGTFVTRGRGQGVVVGTGQQTELGKIAGMMEETKRTAPPITKKLATFTKFIIITCVAFGVINFILGWRMGYDAGYMLLATAGMIVAMIPEGLAGAVIAAFAVGSIAMSRRNALIRRLPAAETLGCTTVICSDKTGTLTKNEMTVVMVHCGGKDCRVSGVGYEPKGEFVLWDKTVESVMECRELGDTLKVGYLCNNAALVEDETGFNVKGDPTEGALIVSATKAGITENLPRLDEIPFESELQYMATLNRGEVENIICVKGSPESVLKMCHSQMVDGATEAINHDNVTKKVEEMAKDALRVLGVAYKVVDRKKTSLSEEDLNGLTFLGLQGMIDSPRPEAIDAIRKCKKAGIRTVMITGDHVQTASAIARQLGIGDGESRAVIGEELQKMSDEDLYEVVGSVSVYARVAPEHKFRIVKQLQKRGHIVAVTGDGVNDAPALKAADIGVAMGITGTEVSKEAADMVLTDDNFATIVAAVEEGRHVFTNIRKVILYLLPTNGGQGLVMIGAVLLSPFIPVFTLRLPIEPVQILWVNLIMAIGCSISLIWEPKEKGILDRPPRDPNEKLFNPLFLQKVGIVSLISAAAAFSLFLVFTKVMGASEDYLTQAQTVAFTTLIMIQLIYLFTARSITESAFTFSPFSNKWILIGAGATLGLQLLIVYSLPLFGVSPFRTAPFPLIWWLPIVLISFLGFLAIELEKFLRRRSGKAVGKKA